ncbi:MAG: DUF2254 family protein [Bryobacteraceae bacterium]
MADVLRAGHEDWFSDARNAVARALSEFLAVPSCIIVGFLAAAAGTYLLDRANPAWLAPARELLRTQVFAKSTGTSNLLSAIAGGLMTVTSITISLLLLALQQSAANMTAQVFDQFLRRRLNQAYFGFFIGLALYTIVTLATVTESLNPVFGAALAVLLTVVALYLLIVLLYTTVNQMRPAQIIQAIHDHALAARECHLRLVRKTRRTPECDGHTIVPVRAGVAGFVARIDVDAIGRAARELPGGAEVELIVAVGSYVAYHDVIAVGKARTPGNADALTKVTLDAVILETQRDIATDCAYGVEQLAMIGWTCISSAKSNPAAGLLTIRALRDIMAHWSAEKEEERQSAILPVVYADNSFEQLMDAFESLAVASSESLQHQAFAEVILTFATMYQRLPPERQPRAEDLILRVLSALGDHVLTRDLNTALTDLVHTLTACGRLETAALVGVAQEKLQHSVGKLNSRSTRVPGQ